MSGTQAGLEINTLLMRDNIAPQRALLTDEPVDILWYAANAFDKGIGSALVTLVKTRGGSARLPGAQMAVGGDATYCGYVSGGCMEAAIATEAAGAIHAGADRAVHLGGGSKFFDLQLPCGGSLYLMIHVLRESGTLRRIISRLDQRQRACWRYIPETQVSDLVDATRPTGWEGAAFFRTYRPRSRLVLYGCSIESHMTARLAEAAGYELIGSEAWGLEGPDISSIDLDTAVVLLLHDLEDELPALRAALASPAFYIGALGSRETHRKRCEALMRLGYDRDDISRIRAPIGLVGKARDASTLALSILAEIAAVRASSDNEAR